jgi:hypothetical protein
VYNSAIGDVAEEHLASPCDSTIYIVTQGQVELISDGGQVSSHHLPMYHSTVPPTAIRNKSYLRTSPQNNSAPRVSKWPYLLTVCW